MATDYGVPLKLTEYVEHDKDKKTQFERTPVAKIYEQIVEDLKTAVNYLTESPQKRPLHRASKEAAQLLLSRVYLTPSITKEVVAIALFKSKSRTNCSAFPRFVVNN